MTVQEIEPFPVPAAQSFSTLPSLGFAAAITALMTLGTIVVAIVYAFIYNATILHYDLHTRTAAASIIRTLTKGDGAHLLNIQGISDAILAIFVLCLLPSIAHRSLRELGVGRPTWRDLRLAFVGFCLAYLGTAFIGALIDNVFHRHDQQQVVKMILGLHGPSVILAIICAVGIAPIAEESVFRGFLYNAVKTNRAGTLPWIIPLFALLIAMVTVFPKPLFGSETTTAIDQLLTIAGIAIGCALIFVLCRRAPQRWTIAIATGLSASIFALCHGELFAVPELLVPGVIFALIYERARSLWANIFTHAMFNSGAFIAIFLFHQTQ